MDKNIEGQHHAQIIYSGAPEVDKKNNDLQNRCA